MGTDFIDGDGSRESEAFESGFFVINFVELFVDEIVGKDTQVDDLGADGDFFDEFVENIWGKRSDYHWRF